MTNKNIMIKKIFLYLSAIIILSTFFYFLFSRINTNNITVKITMKQTQENGISINYKEYADDDRALNVNQGVNSSEDYVTIEQKIPVKNPYSLTLGLNSIDDFSNEIFIKDITASTLFSSRKFTEFNDFHSVLDKEKHPTFLIVDDYVFSSFQLTATIMLYSFILSLFITACLSLIFRKYINNFINTTDYRNFIKLSFVYLVCAFVLYSAVYFFLDNINNNMTVDITMKQSLENGVTVFYKEDMYDGRGLRVDQSVKASETYVNVKEKVPLNYVYNLTLGIHSPNDMVNVVDIKSIKVSTLFSSRTFDNLNDLHYTLDEQKHPTFTIVEGYVFTPFQVTTKIKLFSLLIALFITILSHKIILKVLSVDYTYKNNFKVLLFTGSLFVVFISNLVSIDRPNSLFFVPLASKPKFNSYGSVADASYMASIEKHLKDQFIYNEFLIEDYYAFNRALLKNELNDKYLTKIDDQTMFFAPLSSVSVENISSNVDSINDLSKLLDSKNIPHYYFNVPSKEYMLSDYIPAYCDNQAIEIYDLFNTSIVEKNDYIHFYNLYDFFTEKNLSGIETHYATDHHWKTETALESYKYVLQILQNDGFDVSPDEVEFSSQTYTDRFVGLLSRSVASGYRYNQSPDDFTLIYPRDSGSYTLTTLNDNFTQTGSFRELLDTSSLYGLTHYLDIYTFIHQTNRNKMITNNNIDNDSTVIVLGDSYSLPFAWYLSSNFKNVIQIDPRYKEVGFTEDYINANSDNIDAVINVNYLGTAADLSLFNYFK